MLLKCQGLGRSRGVDTGRMEENLEFQKTLGSSDWTLSELIWGESGFGP